LTSWIWFQYLPQFFFRVQDRPLFPLFLISVLSVDNLSFSVRQDTSLPLRRLYSLGHRLTLDPTPSTLTSYHDNGHPTYSYTAYNYHLCIPPLLSVSSSNCFLFLSVCIGIHDHRYDPLCTHLFHALSLRLFVCSSLLCTLT